MRAFCSTILVLAFILLGCSPRAKGPLSFQTPANWKTQCQTSGNHHFYSVTASTPTGGLLMFSRWPAPGKPEDIPRLVQEMADGFHREAKNEAAGFKLRDETYRVEQFAGELCQGSLVTFEIGSGDVKILQTMFMMSVGGEVWNGQFTGPADAWKQALVLLKGVKKNG